ncbi:Rpn family recombination-promoting nuclease/putative transposase [Ruegeria sp.]|uniref:Rpn family recombination-promoting nuclease/putative transposase n=1 Tax=Ruegeria sp. TaxID=1879320 RepID=UPI003C7EB58F
MKLPKARHDALFRLLVSDPARAAVLLRDYLPSEVVARLDPDRLPVHVEGTAIDGEGVKTQADAIFRLYLRDGDEIIVYALLEHKAQNDIRTPLQLLGHMLRVWKNETDKGTITDGRLPLILPVVFYHGRARWTVPLSIQDMIAAPDGLAHLACDFGHYRVQELRRIAPEDMPPDTDVYAALLALAHAFSEYVSDPEADLLVAGIAETELGRYIMAYIVEQVSLSPERIEAALKRIGTDPDKVEDIMGTAAQAWMEQGKAEGIAEGKVAGIAEGELKAKVATFLHLAQVKFGELSPSQVERVRGATSDELDIWLERLIEVEDLCGVFEGRQRH